jgi:SpoVK/Ycf46/Vps4 family AAA+-type ATPase
MRYQVVVSFGKDKEYSYEFSQSDLDESSADEARRWFDKEFSELKCEPTNPVGKVLIIDKILNIARKGGEKRFVDGKSWAAKFARYTALALGRDIIRVDVEALSIGY